MNEFKVGLLALVAIASIVYMSLKITSNQSGFGEYVTYRTMINDASGIFPKTPIKVAGINAGKIYRIELQGNSALITFKVLKKVRITEGSKLRIKTVGFLGDKYLEIQIEKSEKVLNDMGFIVAETGGGFETIVKDASDLVKDVKVIVSSLKDTLVPTGQIAPMKKILNGLTEMVESAKKATSSLKRIMEGNEKKISDLVGNLQKFAKNVEEVTNKNIEGSSVAKVNKLLDNADIMVKDLKSIVSNIKAGKGTMGKLLVEEEIADEVRETLSGVRKIVSKVEAIRTELALFSGVNSDAGGESAASLRIYPAPERFYVLGMSTSEFGPEKKKKTVTVTNGARSEELRTTQDEDSYRFNVQLGRQIHNWSFRGGLIESSGGLGVDYFFSRIGTKLSVEAFDYREDIGINLRLATEIQLWNIFYGKAQFEDSLEDSRSATFSAGLKFTDEDLKGLLGFFL